MLVEYFEEVDLRIAVEEKLKREVTDYEWKAIIDVIFYEQPFSFVEETVDENGIHYVGDLDYDMKRVRILLDLIRR